MGSQPISSIASTQQLVPRCSCSQISTVSIATTEVTSSISRCQRASLPVGGARKAANVSWLRRSVPKKNPQLRCASLLARSSGFASHAACSRVGCGAPA